MTAALQVGSMAPDDDFFRLGGHSLTAARLLARINRELKLELTLRTIFEAPTIASLSAAVRNAAGQGATATRAPIVRAADGTWAPLTIMQQRIYFAERIGSGGVGYNAPSAHRFDGPMNLEAFEGAFRDVIARQDALRTSIRMRRRDGADLPMLYVASVQPKAPLAFEDLSALPPKERERLLQSKLEELANHRFPMDGESLFIARMFRMAPNEHVLFFMPHHIVWDGWSFDIFYAEMRSLYEARLTGAPHGLPDMRVRYGDYAAWHEEWMRSDEIAAQIQYWSELIDRFPPAKEPKTDRPRDRARTSRGATEYLSLPFDLTEQLKELAKGCGATMSMVALAAYAALMSEWLDDKAPAIGMPVRGRPSHELENVMGFFNNMLPLRLPVDDGLSAQDSIAVVRRVMTDVFANQDAPFELLAQYLKSTRSYQVMFSFQDASQRPTAWGGLAHSRVPLMHNGATEDLNLWMIETDRGVEAGFQYNAELFDRATIARLREKYAALLEAIVADPARSLRDILASLPGAAPKNDPEADSVVSIERASSSTRAAQRYASAESIGPAEIVPMAAATPKPVFAPTQIERELQEIWSRVIGVEEIGLDQNFFDIGGRSMMAIHLMALVEKRWSARLPLTSIVEAPTIRSFAMLLKSQSPRDTVVALREGEAKPGVFFLHDGDGETLLYCGLARRLAPGRPVYGLQPLSRDGVPLVHTRIEDMAAYHVERIRSVQPQGPYMLAGLCAGGVIAFEVALQLQEAGQEVSFVGMIDAGDVEAKVRPFLAAAPRLKNFLATFKSRDASGRVRFDLGTMAVAARKISNVVAYEAKTRLSLLRSRVTARALRKHLNDDSRLPPSLSGLSVRQVYEFARKDYRPLRLFDGDLVLFRSTRGDGTAADEPFVDMYVSPDFGWGARVAGVVRAYDVAGGHSTMLQEPYVDDIARVMNECLDEAASREGLRSRRRDVSAEATVTRIK